MLIGEPSDESLCEVLKHSGVEQVTVAARHRRGVAPAPRPTCGFRIGATLNVLPLGTLLEQGAGCIRSGAGQASFDAVIVESPPSLAPNQLVTEQLMTNKLAGLACLVSANGTIVAQVG